MTPAAVLTAVPDDVLRAGDGHNERGRQAIRLTRYFEQRGHRPTWAEIDQERQKRRAPASRDNTEKGSS